MWNRTAVTSVSFISGSLTLEGRLSLPQGSAPLRGVVVCHPHPQYGGSMDNNVVEGIATALEDSQTAVLVFNFRGVGQSQGTHDRGAGETEDALAAVRFLASHPSVDKDRLGIAGYSFGAMVTLTAAARDQRLRAVALVGCPTSSLDNPEVQRAKQPKLFIHGDRDSVVKAEAFGSLVQRFPQAPEVVVLAGADHFLMGYEDHVGSKVAEFFARNLG